MAKTKAVNAKIAVEVDGGRYGFSLNDIDFDQSRDKIARQIGYLIVDTIYKEVEG